MADTRIFRITRKGGYQNRDEPSTEYATRRELSGRVSSYRQRTGHIVMIEATNAEATEGWADVTIEFIKEDQ